MGKGHRTQTLSKASLCWGTGHCGLVEGTEKKNRRTDTEVGTVWGAEQSGQELGSDESIPAGESTLLTVWELRRDQQEGKEL